MAANIRNYGPADHDAVVELSLRAWAPIFASMQTVVGVELATRLHGEDWRLYQARSVDRTLAAADNHSWVAETEGRATGFVVAAIADPDRCIGEIVMLAVDPADQHHAVGQALTEHAAAWLLDAGMRVAMIETGGDHVVQFARRSPCARCRIRRTRRSRRHRPADGAKRTPSCALSAGAKPITKTAAWSQAKTLGCR